ncbi:hypothetical protein HDU78_004438 [Chytriomyces hyalinus]|nr:hypothetical protein HDU78_004438 [Chytriomyces hyalinus]
MLSHFGSSCPGLSDHKARSDIFRQTLFHVFHSHARLEIPIMQRRFCWNDETLQKWFDDAAKDIPGIDTATILYNESDTRSYPTGRVRNCKMARFRVREDDSALVVIDGQQRLTSSSLLLAAIRDALMAQPTSGELEQVVEMTLDTIRKVLFSGPEGLDLDQVSEEAKMLEDGAILEAARLIPSYPDRRLFYCLIGKNGYAAVQALFPESLSARVCVARNLFDSLATPLNARDLCSLTYSVLYNYTCMSNYLIAPNLNLAQMFQWFQELQINNELAFGGRVLTPGISFNTMDFSRNFFMSVCVDYDLEMQTWMYKQLWLPVEEATSSDSEKFEVLLKEYMASYPVKDEGGADRVPESIIAAAKSSRPERLVMYIRFLVYFYGRVDVSNELEAKMASAADLKARVKSLQSMQQSELEDASDKSVLGFIVHFVLFSRNREL